MVPLRKKVSRKVLKYGTPKPSLGFNSWFRGLGFRVQGLGFRGWGLGFRGQGLGFRAWGLGVGV